LSNSSSANTSGASEVGNNTSHDERVEGYSIGRQARWDRMFDALKAYKSTHGHTLVPAKYPENPQLGCWADDKRQLYRMRLEAEDPEKNNTNIVKRSACHRILTDKKIEKLNSIGFVWSLYQNYWDSRYEELKDYVAEHGNALVPSEYEKNVPLSQWVLIQRKKYKNTQQGVKEEPDELSNIRKNRETMLSEDRIQRLNEIGFVWDVHESQWLERLEELKVYKANHGDTLVPKDYTMQPYLGRWVEKQRLDHRNYMIKKKIKEEWGSKELLDSGAKNEKEEAERLATGMTEERLRLLEAEEFIWSPRDYIWESKFEELCSFAALNGHTAVFRRSSGPYDPLARWADVQRQNYKKYKKGEETRLTEERIEQLNAINFVWENKRKQRGGRKDAAEPKTWARKQAETN